MINEIILRKQTGMFNFFELKIKSDNITKPYFLCKKDLESLREQINQELGELNE